jgi:response regulator RpfG family c-di-GMP phosphodiesterase
MTSPLSNKVPMSVDIAIGELREKSGTQFDPRLVEVFLSEIAPEHIK